MARTRTAIGGPPAVRGGSCAIPPPVTMRSAVAATCAAIGVVARERRRIRHEGQAGLAAQRFVRRALRPRHVQRDLAHGRAQRVQPGGVAADDADAHRRRTPVDVMSMRARAGAVQALFQPRSRDARSSASSSSALVAGVSSGQSRRSARFIGPGAQPEYQRRRATFGHCSRGLRRMVVSAIENGAGSVAVSARPTLPNTVDTSAKPRDAPVLPRELHRRRSGGTPGAVVGMKNRSPSSMRGRKSPPRRPTIGTQEITASAAVTSVNVGRARAKWTNGRYARTSPRVSGFANSGTIVPVRSRRAQRGRDRERDERGRADHQRLREGEGAEQPAGLAAEPEHGHERERGDDQRRQDRGRERARRRRDRAPALDRARGRLERLEPAVARLQRDDVCVDGKPEGDRDPAQAHHRRRDTAQPHRGERQQQHQRQRGERHQRAARVEEKQEHDQHQDRDLLGERARQAVSHAARQVRPIVDGDQLAAGGKPGALAVEHALDLRDHGGDVRAAAGDHDAADRGHEAAEVGHAGGHAGRDANARDVGDAPGGRWRGARRRRRADRRCRDVRADLLDGAAGALAQGGARACDDVGERHARVPQLVRASLDQQLLDLAAQRRHLRHVRDARERRPEHARPETGAAAAATAARTDPRARPSCAPATARPARTGRPIPCWTPRARRRIRAVSGRPPAGRRDARRDLRAPCGDVGPGGEHHVEVRHARHRLAPDGGRARRAFQRAGERRGDRVGDFARRMSHPFGDEDDLGIGELGDGVARQRAARGLAAGSGEQRRGEHETGMAARPGDDAGDHGAAAGVARSASLAARRGDVRRPRRTCPSPRCARRRAARRRST